jgi:hypothetical protein
LDAGVLDAPPVLAAPPPKRPPLAGVLDVLFAVPKSDGVALPVDGVAPNSDFWGVLLPPLLLAAPPKVKPLMMAVVEDSSGVCCGRVMELLLSAR